MKETQEKLFEVHEHIHRARMILASVPSGRDTSVAITKLDEADMWCERAFKIATYGTADNTIIAIQAIHEAAEKAAEGAA